MKSKTLDKMTKRLLVMLCPNQLQNNVLTAMRAENLEQKQIIQQYKNSYSRECKTVRNLQKKLISVEKRISILQQEVKRLTIKLLPLNNRPKKRKPRAIKEWDKISSERTKCRRMSFFKDLLIQTFRTMQVCHRAEVSLWLEENRINLSFSPSDLLQSEKCTKSAIESACHLYLDHMYASEEKHLGDNDAFNDLDYSEIYDCSGNWKKLQIRRLIYVMDCF